MLTDIRAAATVASDDGDGRVHLLLVHTDDASHPYRWYGSRDGRTWEDTEVSAATEEEAIEAAREAWWDDAWDLQWPSGSPGRKLEVNYSVPAGLDYWGPDVTKDEARAATQILRDRIEARARKRWPGADITISVSDEYRIGDETIDEIIIEWQEDLWISCLAKASTARPL